jgi:hypothetical protein
VVCPEFYGKGLIYAKVKRHTIFDTSIQLKAWEEYMNLHFLKISMVIQRLADIKN